MEWRNRIATVLSGLAIFSLITALGLSATVMTYAKVNGYLPEGPWGEYEGNHGPWHRTFILSIIDPDSPIIFFKEGFIYASLAITLSILASFMSLLVKFSLFRGVVFVSSIIAFLFYSKYLYWLID